MTPKTFPQNRFFLSFLESVSPRRPQDVPGPSRDRNYLKFIDFCQKPCFTMVKPMFFTFFCFFWHFFATCKSQGRGGEDEKNIVFLRTLFLSENCWICQLSWFYHGKTYVSAWSNLCFRKIYLKINPKMQLWNRSSPRGWTKKRKQKHKLQKTSKKHVSSSLDIYIYIYIYSCIYQRSGLPVQNGFQEK